MVLLYTLLLFQDVSGGELILVLLAVFLLFGPNKIPEIAKNIAKGLYKLKKATSEIREEVDKVIDPIKQELKEHEKTLKDSLDITKSNTDIPNTSMNDNKSKETPAG